MDAFPPRPDKYFIRYSLKKLKLLKIHPSIHFLLLVPHKVVGTVKVFNFYEWIKNGLPSPFFLIALIFSNWTQITTLKWQECSTWTSVSLQVGVACIETCVWAELLHPSFEHRPWGGCSFWRSFSSIILWEICSISQMSAWLVQVLHWKAIFRIWFCQKFKFYLLQSKINKCILYSRCTVGDLDWTPPQDLDGQTGFSKQNHPEC